MSYFPQFLTQELFGERIFLKKFLTGDLSSLIKVILSPVLLIVIFFVGKVFFLSKISYIPGGTSNTGNAEKIYFF